MPDPKASQKRTSMCRSSERRRERGAVAVEFALAFPILILVFMVMMFLMDVMMVRQEVTNVGFTAMRECVNVQNKSECVSDLVRQAQNLAGSNARYTCLSTPGEPFESEGATFSVVHLSCEYQGFLPLNAIMLRTGINMNDLVDFDIPVFFTGS